MTCHDCGEDACICLRPYDEEDFAFDEDGDDFDPDGQCESCGGEYGDGWSNCTCDMPDDYPDDPLAYVRSFPEWLVFRWHRLLAWRWPRCAHCGRWMWPWATDWCCSRECFDRWIPF